MKKIIFLSLALIFGFSLVSQASSKISGEKKITMTAGTTMMAAGAVASMRQLEEEALDELSNYDGEDEDDNYSGYSGYTGANDDFLDYGGEPGNLLSAVEGHNYTVVIVNAKTAARTIYFMPSCKYRTKDNALTVGTLTEGTFAAIDDVAETNITATSDSYGSVDFLRRFIENNPTNVKAFQIQSSTAAGIQQARITIEEVSPFRQLSARTLKPTMYQDQNMLNDKVINIQGGFDLNDQCVVKLTIAANTSLTVTVICGPVLNGASAMKNKRAKANRTLVSRRGR